MKASLALIINIIPNKFRSCEESDQLVWEQTFNQTLRMVWDGLELQLKKNQKKPTIKN